MKKKFIVAGALAAMLAVSGQAMDLTQPFMTTPRAEAAEAGVDKLVKAARARSGKASYENVRHNMAMAIVYILMVQDQLRQLEGRKVTEVKAYENIYNEIRQGNLQPAKDAITKFKADVPELVRRYEGADIRSEQVKANQQNIKNLRVASWLSQEVARLDSRDIAGAANEDAIRLLSNARQIKELLDLQNEANQSVKPIAELLARKDLTTDNAKAVAGQPKGE